MSTPSDEEALSGEELGTYLMEGMLLSWCAAAAPQVASGARFRWRLTGEVAGEYLVALGPEQIDISPIAVGEGAGSGEIDGEVRWTLSKSELFAFLKGEYKLRTALSEKRLTFHGDDAGYLKLALMFDALASADPVAMEENPQEYFGRRCIEAVAPKLDDLLAETDAEQKAP